MAENPLIRFGMNQDAVRSGLHITESPFHRFFLSPSRNQGLHTSNDDKLFVLPVVLRCLDLSDEFFDGCQFLASALQQAVIFRKFLVLD
jgi:hypothetical protein